MQMCVPALRLVFTFMFLLLFGCQTHYHDALPAQLVNIQSDSAGNDTDRWERSTAGKDSAVPGKRKFGKHWTDYGFLLLSLPIAIEQRPSLMFDFGYDYNVSFGNSSPEPPAFKFVLIFMALLLSSLPTAVHMPIPHMYRRLPGSRCAA
jgi:hypothetical protein